MVLATDSLSPGVQATPSAHPPKRTRNKLTLNCAECVTRKIRCDRARPRCASCIRRPADCSYSRGPPSSTSMRTQRLRQTSSSSAPPIDPERSPLPRSMVCADGPLIPSEPPISHDTRNVPPSPPFAVPDEVSEHPFLNYWTMTGGIAEVISVLPSKHDADLLVESYFDTVDPIYPIVTRSKFTLEYEYFWRLSGDELLQYDASQLALQFAIYATGAQFINARSVPACPDASKIYLSASYQSLCLYSYLGRFSVTIIQCVIILGYHLINKNLLYHAWTFSGIALRQAYGIALNRHPTATQTDMKHDEALFRCKIWQAVVVQDAMLSLYLQLPPGTMHSDLGPDSLELNPARSITIPHAEDSELFGSLESSLRDAAAHDLAYMRAMWEVAAFVRNHISVPRSHERSITSSASHKAFLISELRAMYQTWKFPFNSCDYCGFGASNQRLAHQMIGLSTKYFGILAILHIDENEEAGVRCDTFEALDAAQHALAAFFALVRLFPNQVDRYGGYHIRAYAQAVSTIIGNILVKHNSRSGPAENHLQLAKSYFDRYYDILNLCKGTEEYERSQKRRLTSLRNLAAQFYRD